MKVALICALLVASGYGYHKHVTMPKCAEAASLAYRVIDQICVYGKERSELTECSMTYEHAQNVILGLQLPAYRGALFHGESGVEHHAALLAWATHQLNSCQSSSGDEVPISCLTFLEQAKHVSYLNSLPATSADIISAAFCCHVTPKAKRSPLCALDGDVDWMQLVKNSNYNNVTKVSINCVLDGDEECD